LMKFLLMQVLHLTHHSYSYRPTCTQHLHKLRSTDENNAFDWLALN
jgi:hypothetical protein